MVIDVVNLISLSPHRFNRIVFGSISTNYDTNSLKHPQL